MNTRTFFHRHAFVALFLCPLLWFATTTIDFVQPKLFKTSEIQYTAPFLKFISAGFWPAAADVMWMQTIQKIGIANYSAETLEDTLSFYRLLTTLDPHFYEAYAQAGIAFGFYYGAAGPALEMLDRGIKEYESGSAPPHFWRHAFTLYIYHAYVSAFVKNDWAQAKVDFINAASIQGAPLYLQSMKMWLKEENSEKVLASKVLKLLIQNETDPTVRTKYEEKLKQYE